MRHSKLRIEYQVLAYLSIAHCGKAILLHNCCLFVKPVLNLQAMTDSADTRVSLILAGVPEQVNIPIKYETPLIIAPPSTIPPFVTISITPIGHVNYGSRIAS